jgi:hypothetical protein
VLFVTGFPGFIARRLVRALLEADERASVVALVEEKQRERARECAEAINSARIEIVTGDISREDLGLEETQRQRLRRETSQVFHLAAPQLGSEHSPFNVVPVDFIVAAIVADSSDEAASGETLHLVDPEPISAADLAGMLSREYAGKEPSLRVPAAVLKQSLRIKRVRDYFSGAPPESITYLNHPVRFDTRKASQLLERHGLTCPRFEDYAGSVVRFFREHEHDSAFVPGAS